MHSLIYHVIDIYWHGMLPSSMKSAHSTKIKVVLVIETNLMVTGENSIASCPLTAPYQHVTRPRHPTAMKQASQERSTPVVDR